MEYNSENILIADSLEEVASAERAGYVAHAFCTAGSCEIVYNDTPMSFRKGDIMIVLFGNMVTAVRPASDFRVRVIYISVSYMETCTPHTSYGITGGLSLYRQPIMCLNEEEQHLCESDFDAIIRRMESPLTYFHGDMMMAVTQTLFIDLYEFHAQQNGKQIHVGKRFFANFHFTVLDEAQVTFGDDCFVGPNVSIYTACHSTNPVERNTRAEWAKPVTVGNNVWIGGSVTILAGVTVGDNCTIGAGSVVTHDIPANSIAVGVPAKIIKQIEI